MGFFFHDRKYINDFGKWQLSVLILFPVDHCFLFEGLVGFSWCALFFFFLRRIVKTLIFSLTIVWKEMFWKKWVYIYLFFFLFICFICVSIVALKLSHFGCFFWCLTHWNGIQFFKDIKGNENFIRVLENYACTLITHICTNHHFVQFMIHNGVNKKKKEHPFTLKLWQAAASLQKYKRFDDLKYHLAGLQVYF